MLAFMARGVARAYFAAWSTGIRSSPPSFRSTITPVDVIERLNIGSRPASRRSGEGIENLRAIPWVFSWAQVRVGFPGVFTVSARRLIGAIREIWFRCDSQYAGAPEFFSRP